MGTGDYTLSGWLRCGHCGGPVVGSTFSRQRSYGVYRFRRYRCSSHTVGRGCTVKKLYPAERLEAAVYQVLVDDVLRPDVLMAMVNDVELDAGARERAEREVRRLAAKQDELPAIKPPVYQSKRWMSVLFFLICLVLFGATFSMLETEGLIATAVVGAFPFWAIRKRVRLENTIAARTAELQEAERALIKEQQQRIEFVERAFGKYVSRTVVDEIITHPGS